MSELDLIERLHNWARVLRSHKRRGTCGSIESQYRSPQRGHWSLPVVSIRDGADVRDAWVIEAAWSAIDEPWRALIADWYVKQIRPGHAMRLFCSQLNGADRRRHKDIEAELARGHALLQQSLARSDAANRNIVLSITRKALALVAPLRVKV